MDLYSLVLGIEIQIKKNKKSEIQINLNGTFSVDVLLPRRFSLFFQIVDYEYVWNPVWRVIHKEWSYFSDSVIGSTVVCLR